MMLPQRPYFPIAPLADAVAYPAEPGTFDAANVSEAVAAVGLPALVSRIEDEAHWNRMLSLGEQQRLGVARALLLAPDYLFLDEATASLDEPAEAALYQLLEQRLPDTAIISIGHRATLAAFHRRKLSFNREGGQTCLAEERPDAVALKLSASRQRKRRRLDRAAASPGSNPASFISGCRASGQPTAWR